MAARTRKAGSTRRRVRTDPAPLTFATRAEAHRQAGEFDDAIRLCREGLLQHPDHQPARVTLGRALLAVGRYEEAQAELAAVAAAGADQRGASAAAPPQPVGRKPRRGAAGGGAPAAADPFARALDALSRHEIGSGAPLPLDDHRALQELEAWLAAILRDRAARRGAGTIGA